MTKEFCMFCMHCGQELPLGANFCFCCGTRVGEVGKDAPSYTEEKLRIAQILNTDNDPNMREAALLGAIDADDLDIVKELLDDGVSPDAVDYGGESALFNAVYYKGNEEIVQVLLNAGANPNTSSSEGIHILSEYVNHSCNISIVKMLIDAGANVNTKDGDGDSVLANALLYNNLSVIELLLNAGADPNVLNDCGVSILPDYIDNHCDTAIVKMLIDAGADVNAKDGDGDSLLSLAILYNNLEVVELLRNAGAKE